MVVVYWGFLGLLVLERIVELAISRRNQKWALSRGGVEYGAKHFRFMSALHTAFFVSCGLEVWLFHRPFVLKLALAMLALSLVAQVLRYWAIVTLGRYWNVRVIVVPGALAVNRGPYRFLRHPNYLAVTLEIVAIPMIHTAYLTAMVFTVLNAWMLTVRIRCEESALEEHESYHSQMGDRDRFVPKFDKPMEPRAGGVSE